MYIYDIYVVCTGTDMYININLRVANKAWDKTNHFFAQYGLIVYRPVVLTFTLNLIVGTRYTGIPACRYSIIYKFEGLLLVYCTPPADQIKRTIQDKSTFTSISTKELK